MFEYNLTNNLRKIKLPKDLLDCLKTTLDSAAKVLKKLPKRNYFELTIVGDKRIRSLNREFRDKDRKTDVISLEYNQPFVFINQEDNHLGEIYLDYYQCLRQAKKFNHSLEREFCFLVLHGVLHLIGYDHMKKEDEVVMFGLQDEILDKTNLPILRRK